MKTFTVEQFKTWGSKGGKLGGKSKSPRKQASSSANFAKARAARKLKRGK